MTLTSLVAVQSNIHPGPNLPGQVSKRLCKYRRFCLWAPPHGTHLL